MKCLRKNDDAAGAIGFVMTLLIVGMVVSALVGALALTLNDMATDEAIAGGNLSNSSAGDGVGGGSDDTTGAGVPGGPAMLLLIGLLFIVIPLVIFAKAAT